MRCPRRDPDTDDVERSVSHGALHQGTDQRYLDNEPARRGEFFDLMTFREAETFTVTQDSGRELTITSSERFYCHRSYVGCCDRRICRRRALWVHAGQYNRERKPNPDDFEMMAIARKRYCKEKCHHSPGGSGNTWKLYNHGDSVGPRTGILVNTEKTFIEKNGTMTAG